MARDLVLHIGTYDKGKGKGLVPLVVGADGSLALGKPYAAARNASFGARRKGLVYLVDEKEHGAIGVHRCSTAKWQEVARVASAGSAPCYLALDPAGERLAVANYESGNLALYRLDGRGIPKGLPAVFQHEGSGPNAKRQTGPHLHCVRFAGDFLYAVDLGTDQVVRLTLKGASFGEAGVAFTAPAGSGPRHLLFHPNKPFAFLVTELTATLTLLSVGPTGLTALQTLPTAPPDFTGDNAGGHLALNADGSRVYASNRGNDSIAVFAFDGEALQLLQHVPTDGSSPRHFALLEDRGITVVAHEKDSRVTLLVLGPDGMLAPTGKGVVIPGACFVLA